MLLPAQKMHNTLQVIGNFLAEGWNVPVDTNDFPDAAARISFSCVSQG